MSTGLEADVSVDISLDEAIYNCRAMRKLKTDEVPEELLIKLVDAARQAPSGSNTQNSRWIVARNPTVKRQLAELNRKFAEPYIKPSLEGNLGTEQLSPDKHMRQLQAVVWQIEHMHEIPALVVACFDYPEKVDGPGIYRSANSVWPGVQNLLLMARALGLGATPTTLGLRDQDAVREILKLPETFAALCLIPVGYPMGNFGPVKRRPLSEIMRFDSWG